MTLRIDLLPPGDCGLGGARPGPDLAEHEYVEEEYVLRGHASSFRANDLPADGQWDLHLDSRASFTTRAVVRRPLAQRSGTIVVEWLNVSSGRDAAPGWTYQAEEIIRRGHAWIGVSAQYGGVEGGLASVSVGDLRNPGLRGDPSGRYDALHHPGDAFAFDIFSQIGDAAVRLLPEAYDVATVLALGQSQSAFCLTTYVNGVQPTSEVFDGFLIHSRGGAAAPLGEAGAGLRMDEVVAGEATRLRTDLDVPVLVVQTETDLFGRLNYYPARQSDHDRLRVWEVAGTAHADKYLIDEFEDFLGCPTPVNRGQQSFVLKAALRHLDRWARGGAPAPGFPPLETSGEGFVLDAFGNVGGGARTPVVDAPVEVLSGSSGPGASALCRLFGSTAAADPRAIRERYRDVADYGTEYAAACDAACGSGLVLIEDRDAILADARPDLVGEERVDDPPDLA